MSARETIASLIRNEFDSTDWYNTEKLDELILTAHSYGLTELAEEMQNDISA